jgi:small subunit ribosomal protein S17
MHNAMEQNQKTRNTRKQLTGRVVKNQMDKTLVVSVERRQKHKLYGKFITRTSRFKAHDEQNDANVGDLVQLMETRPLSKDKRWRLVEILERAK